MSWRRKGLHIASSRALRFVLYGLLLSYLTDCSCTRDDVDEIAVYYVVLMTETALALWVMIKADAIVQNLLAGRLKEQQDRLTATIAQWDNATDTDLAMQWRKATTALHTIKAFAFAMGAFLIPLSLGIAAFSSTAIYFVLRLGDVHTDLNTLIQLLYVAAVFAVLGVAYLALAMSGLRRTIIAVEQGMATMPTPVAIAAVECQRIMMAYNNVLNVVGLVVGSRSLSR